MVERHLAKVDTGVRFPSFAPENRHREYGVFFCLSIDSRAVHRFMKQAAPSSTTTPKYWSNWMWLVREVLDNSYNLSYLPSGKRHTQICLPPLCRIRRYGGDTSGWLTVNLHRRDILSCDSARYLIPMPQRFILLYIRTYFFRVWIQWVPCDQRFSHWPRKNSGNGLITELCHDTCIISQIHTKICTVSLYNGQIFDITNCIL